MTDKKAYQKTYDTYMLGIYKLAQWAGQLHDQLTDMQDPHADTHPSFEEWLAGEKFPSIDDTRLNIAQAVMLDEN